MATINTLDELISDACTKAMEACVKNLNRLGWTASDIHDHADTLLPRLREACKAVLDEAVADFIKAYEGGARGWAASAFYVPFIAAGVKVGSDIDAECKAAG
jgi:hypothetical protein